MQRRSYLVCCALFLLSLVFTVGCTNPASQMQGQSNPQSNSTGTPVLQVGFSAWPGWAPWQVAQEEKIFNTHKAAVEMKWFDGYGESINALTAGQLQGNSQALSDTISAVANGADQVVVLVNDNSNGNDKIIVREGINSIADLKGKKVAVEEGTVNHYLLLLGLKQAGLSPKDIDLQPLEAGKAAAAFAAGQVDAVSTYPPFTTQALTRANSKELFSSKEFPGAVPDLLVFERKFVNEHPEQVQAMVDSWFATLDFIQAQPDQALPIKAKRTGVSVAEFQSYAAGIKMFSLADNLKAFQASNDRSSLQFTAQETSQFLIDLGLTKTTPDLAQLFDDRFIKAHAQQNPNA